MGVFKRRSRIRRLRDDLNTFRNEVIAHIGRVHDDVVRHADVQYQQSLNHADRIERDLKRNGVGGTASSGGLRDLRHDLHRRMDAFETRLSARIAPVDAVPARVLSEVASAYAVPDQISGAWRMETLPEDALYWEMLLEVEAAVSRCGVTAAMDLQSACGAWVQRMRDAGIDARGCEMNGCLRAAAAAEGVALDNMSWRAALSGQENTKYAAISGFGLLSRLPVDTAVECVEAATAALAPGGVLIFEVPVPATPLWGQDPSHCTAWTRQALEAMFAGFGLHTTTRHWGALPDLERKLRTPHTDPDLAMLLYGPQHIIMVAQKPLAEVA